MAEWLRTVPTHRTCLLYGTWTATANWLTVLAAMLPTPQVNVVTWTITWTRDGARLAAYGMLSMVSSRMPTRLSRVSAAAQLSLPVVLTRSLWNVASARHSPSAPWFTLTWFVFSVIFLSRLKHQSLTWATLTWRRPTATWSWIPWWTTWMRLSSTCHGQTRQQAIPQSAQPRVMLTHSWHRLQWHVLATWFARRQRTDMRLHLTAMLLIQHSALAQQTARLSTSVPWSTGLLSSTTILTTSTHLSRTSGTWLTSSLSTRLTTRTSSRFLSVRT